MKAQYFLPETIDQLKFQFFPDIFGGEYNNTFLFDTVWQRFPNGRRKREILLDPMSGQKYEKYEGEVRQVGNSLLEEEEEEFDDEFEEDIEEKKILETWQKNEDERNKSELPNGNIEADLKVSRWIIYEAFASTLDR